jgi:3-phenylpropionate/cinnamic acid dioxygenase small subunit
MTLSLADRAEINDLLARYGFAIDLRKWDGLRSVFAEDAVIDYDWTSQHVGIDAIVECLRASASSVAGTQHLMHTTMVTGTGDGTAEGIVHVTAHHIAEGAPPAPADATFTVTGTYTDRYARTDAGWRIKYRRLTLVTQAGNPGILTVQ